MKMHLKIEQSFNAVTNLEHFGLNKAETERTDGSGAGSRFESRLARNFVLIHRSLSDQEGDEVLGSVGVRVLLARRVATCCNFFGLFMSVTLSHFP